MSSLGSRGRRRPRPIEGRQILAVRWLEGAGGIELEGLRQPLEVGLTLGIPRLQEHGFRLVPDPGEEVPAVTLRSPCSETAVRVEGYDSHDVDLLLTPAAGSSTCVIDIDPSFRFLHMVRFDKRSVVLERLVWNET